jgi:hydroxymethylpyrimidine/phosphomethylpyrimidine kinase
MTSVGVHVVPIMTGSYVRDTAQIFEHYSVDEDIVTDQARAILEDLTVQAIKVGFASSPETLAVIAETLSDYADIPVVAYMPDLSWWNDVQIDIYHDAFQELVLPQTEVLVGSHQTLTDFLLPDWESERPASPRELAVAAAEHGANFVLVTGVLMNSSKSAEQFLDNVLASAQGAITGEKFERFEASFNGAGDTLSASLAALLASGGELQNAVGESLAFLDQSLDAGFRPGMGNVIPDRFFWALAPGEDDGGPEAQGDDAEAPGSRRIH